MFGKKKDPTMGAEKQAIMSMAIMTGIDALVKKYHLPHDEAVEVYMDQFATVLGMAMGETLDELKAELNIDDWR